MNISTLCRRDVVSVPASASIRDAAAAMRDEHVGALAVTDPYQPGRVVGIVTDRDLVVELLAAGRPADGQAVGAVCQGTLAGVPAGASLQDAVLAMHRAGVRRLLVTGSDKQVIGLVSLDDLLQAVAGELAALAGTLRLGAQREAAQAPTGSPEGRWPGNLYVTDMLT
jgi:signal-transduction protein with cAMP-binding, CBS, and nucleotidyltransferase domain